MALLTRRSLRFFLSKTLSSSSLLPLENQLLPFCQIHGPLTILHSTFSTNNRTPPPPSGGGYSPVNDPSPNWSNRPPKETILLDGCDYKHWLIVMEFPEDPKPSEDKMISSYVKTLATVLGSEEEAKKKIYSVCTTTYTGFGALISEELSYKVKGLPGVLWVLPDSYLDVRNKDYGGDLLVDGKVVHRPQYRFDQTYNRNRSRAKHDTRRETMQVQSRGQMSKAGQSISPTTEDRKDAFQEPQEDPTSPVRGTGGS